MTPGLDGDRLCACLGDHLSRRVRLAGPPQPIPGGFMNAVWRIALDVVDAEALDGVWAGDLVVRRFRPDVAVEAHRVELAFHRFVWETGYPTAEPLLFVEDASVLGAPFIVMAWLPGTPLMSWLERPSPRTLRVAGVLATCMLDLHRLDTAGAPSDPPPLDASGCLADLGVWEAHVRDRVVARAIEILARHEPGTDPQPAVCHLDLNPFNILVDGDAVSGVVDWTNCRIADRHLDVADVDAVLRTAPVDLPKPLAAIAGVGRRYLAHQFVRAYGRARPLDRRTLTWFAAAAACRRRLGARADAATGPTGLARGFTSPAYIDALGAYIEAATARVETGSYRRIA